MRLAYSHLVRHGFHVLGDDNSYSFSTWFDGNMPSLPFNRPVHQSAFSSLTIWMISPDRNVKSSFS